MRFIVAVTLSILSTFASAQEVADEALEEIVLVHYNWEYPAFYEPASRKTSRAMNFAVIEFCSETLYDYDLANEDEKWRERAIEVCGSDDRQFFRGVDGWGKRSDLGFVCTGSTGREKQRYFSEFMLRDWSWCIQIYFDPDEEKHVIPLPSAA